MSGEEIGEKLKVEVFVMDIMVGDEFVEKDVRERTLKVLHVAVAGRDHVARSGALCVTRGGKLAVVSLDRLLDHTRFVRREKIV